MVGNRLTPDHPGAWGAIRTSWGGMVPEGSLSQLLPRFGVVEEWTVSHHPCSPSLGVVGGGRFLTSICPHTLWRYAGRMVPLGIFLKTLHRAMPLVYNRSSKELKVWRTAALTGGKKTLEKQAARADYAELTVAGATGVARG